MSKQRLSLFVLLVLAVGLVLLFAARHEAQTASKNDAPTDVKRGELTDRQRAHSELYKGRRHGADKLGDNSEDRDIRMTVIQEYGSPGPGTKLTGLAYIRSKSCGADAIVLAKAVSKESQLTPDETYIFTDYQLSVAQVLKDDKAAPIDANKGIAVTQGGGKIRLDGQVIELIDEGLQQGMVLGDKYLLFLKRVPATGAYEIISGSARVDRDDRLKRIEDPFKDKGLQGSSLSSVVESIAEYTSHGRCTTK